MKKLTALLLVVAMVASLTGCSMAKKAVEDKISETINNAMTDIAKDASNSISDAFGDILGDAENTIGQGVDDVANEAAHDVKTALNRHDPSYWADRFGTNYCPFSISTLGIYTDYHFRNGGELENWVFCEENTSGWYVYNGYIISADNTFALKIDECDSLSSCCSYDATPFMGDVLDKDERASYFECGTFHVLNSYTPIRTNWGIKILRGECGELFDNVDFKMYDLGCALGDQEHFEIHFEEMDYDGSLETTKLWACAHRDYNEYPEILDDKFLEEAKAVQIGTFEGNDDTHSFCCYAYIPNEKADGFPEGMVDLVVTYGDGENITVGVVTVGTGVGGKG